MRDNTAAVLKGEVVVLEPLESRHEDALFEAAADARIWRWMPYDPSESRESFSAWFRSALGSSRAGNEAAFAVLDASNGVPVGSTRYLALRPEHRALEIGWTWLSRSVWGNGTNTEAKLLLLEHAFERLGYLRVEFKTDSRNERSRAALEALPARFEGVFRKHMLVRGGDRRDSAYYSIIDEEWPRVKASLKQRLAFETSGKKPPSEHPNAALIRCLYDARDRNDEGAIRSVLSGDVIWHEPDVGAGHTGDLHGPDAVLAMIRDARGRTGGTFSLRPQEIVANGEHAVALVDWSAERHGEALEGKEVAVYRVRAGRVVEVHFHQDDQNLDRRFWE
ncbi:GNAT family N-acetyltransferase [Rubrobacter marinus]|uniref:GNAT family N-acetyltransferase n=1 Tax=Rubrobacter marinus TaxID=2653852 RepID=UPI00140E727E|nr:GNAT family N-acetyltransferase [Rubrobacter marinus]